ncbi:cupredoxin domain-containing protein [Pseudonocardia adelaidensis]
MKSRRWIAAAALAAAVVFLVMVTGEHGPAAPDAAPAPVASSEAVLASDGGPPEDANGGAGAMEADRDEVIGALQGLLDALGVSADELADGADKSDCAGGQEKSDSGRNSGNGGANDCTQSEPASDGRSGDAKITIASFAFGQPLTVAPGTKVEVVNTDAATHNVTAADGSFETPDLKQGDTATITAPTTPGRYEFSCTLHPEMTGTLIVEGGGGEQGRSRSSGGNDSSRQHATMAPGRDGMGGSSNGY